MERAYDKELLDFIQNSPSVYHMIAGQKQRLLAAGYTQLLESEAWELRPGGKYFLTRNGSSIAAFRVPEGPFRGFMIMASHSDSPALKVKEHPEITVEGTYRKLNVELYGGALLAPWFDRPLSVAGRLFLRTAEGVRPCLVDAGRDLVLIPSLAIHMNREVNAGYEYRVQRDLLPLYGGAEARDLTALLAREAGADPADVLDHDLFVYDRQAPSIWGAEREFLSSPRLDDTQCAFASLTGFLESEGGESLPVHVVFDNEEIGSSTRQGADSTLLADTLRRITAGLGLDERTYLEKLSQDLSGKAVPELPALRGQRPRHASQLSGQVRPGEPPPSGRRRGPEIQRQPEVHHRRGLRGDRPGPGGKGRDPAADLRKSLGYPGRNDPGKSLCPARGRPVRGRGHRPAGHARAL